MNILIVDDSLIVLDSIKDGLEMDGYPTFAASSVDKALEILNETQIDVIITDLLMPIKSGFELIQTLKNDNKLPKKLIVSTAGLDHALTHEKECGRDYSHLNMNELVDSILQKPYDIEVLTSAIEG